MIVALFADFGGQNAGFDGQNAAICGQNAVPVI